jgi:hypothetical protein
MTGPQIRLAGSVNKLGRHLHRVACPEHRARYQRIDVQLPSDPERASIFR